MIVCGWCARPASGDRCAACGHADPARPWLQRGQQPPEAPPAAGRPSLSDAEIRRRLDAARAAGAATVEQAAEAIGVDPRTVRRWRARVSA